MMKKTEERKGEQYKMDAKCDLQRGKSGKNDLVYRG